MQAKRFIVFLIAASCIFATGCTPEQEMEALVEFELERQLHMDRRHAHEVMEVLEEGCSWLC